VQINDIASGTTRLVRPLVGNRHYPWVLARFARTTSPAEPVVVSDGLSSSCSLNWPTPTTTSAR